MPPTLAPESRFWREGFFHVAGLDEVGRGCLAGPVVAGAVILPVDTALGLVLRAAGVRDSKQLPPPRREALLPVIRMLALGVAVGEASAREIDEHGIVRASNLAMRRALAALPVRADALLLDAFALPGMEQPQQAIIRGDDISLSIAAASIVAKVFRDRLMLAYETEFPGYQFASNKGYAAPAHRAALQARGPTPIHRLSWKPLRELEVRQLPLAEGGVPEKRGECGANRPPAEDDGPVG